MLMYGGNTVISWYFNWSWIDFPAVSSTRQAAGPSLHWQPVTAWTFVSFLALKCLKESLGSLTSGRERGGGYKSRHLIFSWQLRLKCDSINTALRLRTFNPLLLCRRPARARHSVFTAVTPDSCFQSWLPSFWQFLSGLNFLDFNLQSGCALNHRAAVWIESLC